MSAISLPRRLTRVSKPSNSASFHDVSAMIKSWGRRGIFWGALFGFALGAILVAAPITTDTLTLGVFGTLLVGAIECAAIAGAFAAFAAALYAKSAFGGGVAQFERTLIAERQSTVIGSRDFPRAEWQARRPYPVEEHKPSSAPIDDLNAAFSLPEAQARLNTIDAWENGNTGP